MKAYFRLFTLLMILLMLVGACVPAAEDASIPVANVSIVQEPAITHLSPAAQAVFDQLQGLPIGEFFEEAYRQIAIRDPDILIYFVEGSYANLQAGPYAKYGITNDHFTNISDAYIRETQEIQHVILDLLHTYDRLAMSYDQQVTYDTYEWYLNSLIEEHQFMYYNFPINSESSWGMSQDTALIYLLVDMEIKTRQDADDYIARLSNLDIWVEQMLEGLKLREQAGIIPSKYMLRCSLAQLNRGYSFNANDRLESSEDNPLYTFFVKKLEKNKTISGEEKQILAEQARAEVERTVIPAWKKLRDYLDYLLTIAPEETGAWNLPDGQAYYAYKLRSATGTKMTAEQIHQLGLSEVARLQDEMRSFAHRELGYPSDITMYQLRKQLMKDAGPLRDEEVLPVTQALVDGVEAKRNEYFNIYPSKEVIVKIAYPDVVYDDPAFSEPGPTVIRIPYGIQLPRYELPSWLYHETIPGHVFSQMLFYELDLSAPTFHKTAMMPDYLEGWALYMEELTWEMGLYENDPYGNLGRLEFRILRAARLVTETGIHTQGWTLENATSYISAATGRPTPPSEVIRYIFDPGQGCSYYLGYLKIMQLRQRAQDRLRDEFDIREFHDVILEHGQMPLPVMERVVDDWIEAKLK